MCRYILKVTGNKTIPRRIPHITMHKIDFQINIQYFGNDPILDNIQKDIRKKKLS